jgi:L-seryl-tRNA(Ser) seleniumtransferase
MLGTPLEQLRQRAETLAASLTAVAGVSAQVREDVAYVGGGSLPDQSMKSWVVEVQTQDMTDATLALRLRLGPPAVMGRLRDGKLVLDVRTVFPEQETALVSAVRAALSHPLGGT